MKIGNLTVGLPRMVHWIAIALLLLGAIAWLSPQQLPVVLYKLALYSLFAVVGYWADRSLFPYARPHQFHDDSLEHAISFAAVMLRRAFIILGAVLTGGLGL